MRKLEVVTIIGVAAGWWLLLFSVAALMMFWRVDNEPGVAAEIARPYLIAALVSFFSGGPLFVGSNLYLLLATQTKTALLIAWAVVIGITAMACLFSPLLLILMV